MKIVLRRSGGHNIVLRPMALPRGSAEATVPAVRVMVGKRSADQPYSATQLVGIFVPGIDGEIEYNPVTDRNLLFGTISLSANDTPSAVNWEDAVWATLLFSRETDAPTVVLIGDATNTSVELQVTGFTQFAVKRRVRRAVNPDMSNATETVSDYTGRAMPTVVVLTREADHDALTEYITVAHSSGGAFGAESEALAITFADSGGGGGSTGGDGTPYPKDQIGF